MFIIVRSFNQLPTDTFNKTYAYRSNSFSRILFYKPAIFVILNLKTFIFSKRYFSATIKARDIFSSSGCREFSPEHNILLEFF